MKNITANSEKDRYYVVISPYEAYKIIGAQTLYDVLCHRICPSCEIYALETLEEADTLVLQRYPYIFYSIPALAGSTPMGLPVTGTFQVKDLQTQQVLQARMPSAVSETPETTSCAAHETSMIGMPSAITPELQYPPDVEPGIVWSLDAMNSFGTAPGLQTLVSHLSNALWVYPHAMAWKSQDEAKYRARDAYLARFYRRYDSRQEVISLPTQALSLGDMFHDADYAEREEVRQENAILSRLRSYGLL